MGQETHPSACAGGGWLSRPLGVTVTILVLAALSVSPGRSSAQSLDVLMRDDGRMRGDPKAPVTLIEYSDFTCGFCQKFFLETWPRIQAKYVVTGRVRFLYRDFPRAFQGPGLETALASRCAGDQGRYWQMHDRLFGGDRKAGPAEVQRHAERIGLDLPAFSKCLRQKAHEKAIFQDRQDGVDLGFRGTPGFVLFLTEHPEQATPIVIPGAFPYEVFEEQIDRLLRREPRGNGRG